MNTSKRGRTPVYANAFKVIVAREYLSSNHSYSVVAKKYELPGPKTVNSFVRWYKKHYGTGKAPVVEAEGLVSEDVSDKQLSRQLKEANLKIAGLELLIETAQKELGIDIIKKPGTKQL